MFPETCSGPRCRARCSGIRSHIAVDANIMSWVLDTLDADRHSLTACGGHRVATREENRRGRFAWTRQTAAFFAGAAHRPCAWRPTRLTGTFLGCTHAGIGLASVHSWRLLAYGCGCPKQVTFPRGHHPFANSNVGESRTIARRNRLLLVVRQTPISSTWSE
jgi:hypothetical protein